jgi:hypothetical protein
MRTISLLNNTKKRTKELLITTAGVTFSSSFYQSNKREITENTCQFTIESTKPEYAFYYERMGSQSRNGILPFMTTGTACQHRKIVIKLNLKSTGYC